MNVRLRKIYQWLGGIIWDDQYMINSYEILVRMTTNTEDQELQNIAYHRMNYWIYDVMLDSVLMAEGNQQSSTYQATNQRVILLPEEPVDQLVGIMLFSKLNAIMEGNILVTELCISSRVGDDMAYYHSAEENLGPFEQPGWWNDSRPIWSAGVPKRSGNKVVTLGRAAEWNDHDLAWTASTDQDTSVVFANFKNTKDADQPIQ